jgi:hypothetical protein
MKKLLATVLLVLVSSPLLAQRKSVYVHGYTRSDGTYVSPHYRAAPGTASPSAPAASGSSWTAPSGSASVGGGKVHIQSYTRKDGHLRRASLPELARRGKPPKHQWCAASRRRRL